MLITWEPPPPSQRNGVITYYTVLVTSDSGQKQVYNVSADQLSLRIQGNVMAILSVQQYSLHALFFSFFWGGGGGIIVMMCPPIRFNCTPLFF